MAANSLILLACAAYAAGCADLQSLPDPPTAPAVAPIVAPSADAGPRQLKRAAPATPAPRIAPTRVATDSWIPDDGEDDSFGGVFYRPFYPASRPRAGRS